MPGLIEKYYRNNIVHRYDDDGYIKYFTGEDFDLSKEPFSFKSGSNTLKGYFYTYGKQNGDLVVFVHGLGGGHRSYMREIDLLCKKGYTVFSYDNTGCWESEGESIRGLSQSLADLDSALDTLNKENIRSKYNKLIVMGHSWGGYAAGNITNYKDGIDRIVVMSGFVSVKEMIDASINIKWKGLKKFIIKKMLKIEEIANPSYYLSSSLDAINKANSSFFIIQSEDDQVVSYEKAGLGYVKSHTTNPDVKYLIMHGRKHNPNYTEDAVIYMNNAFYEFNELLKKKKLGTVEEKKVFLNKYDFMKMTDQDEEVWNQIFEFIK